jgi:hypothetical protein
MLKKLLLMLLVVGLSITAQGQATAAEDAQENAVIVPSDATLDALFFPDKPNKYDSLRDSIVRCQSASTYNPLCLVYPATHVLGCLTGSYNFFEEARERELKGIVKNITDAGEAFYLKEKERQEARARENDLLKENELLKKHVDGDQYW